MSIHRGEIYRVDLLPIRGSEQQGSARPCVVLSLDVYNNKLPTIGVVPLSTAPRALVSLIVSVPSAGRADSIAICNQLRTIDKTRIVGGKMGDLGTADLQAVEYAIRSYYGLS